MTAEIRTPSEDERTQVIDVLRTSLNFPRSWAEERGATTPLADYRCAYVDGRIVATAAGYRFRQWFGGRDLIDVGRVRRGDAPRASRDGPGQRGGAPGPARCARRRGIGQRVVSGGPAPLSLDRLRARRNVQRASPGAGRDPVRPGRRPPRRRRARPRSRPRGTARVLPRVGATRERAVGAHGRRLVDPADPAPVRRGDRARRGGPRPTTGRSKGSRRSATPTPRAVTWRSTSAWNARRSARSRSAPRARCSPTSGRSVAWGCGSNGAARRRIPSPCWSPSSRSRPRSGSAGCSGCSTCGRRSPHAGIRRSMRRSWSRCTIRRSRRTRDRGG